MFDYFMALVDAANSPFKIRLIKGGETFFDSFIKREINVGPIIFDGLEMHCSVVLSGEGAYIVQKDKKHRLSENEFNYLTELATKKRNKLDSSRKEEEEDKIKKFISNFKNKLQKNEGNTN